MIPRISVITIFCIISEILIVTADTLGKNPLGGTDLDDEDISEGSGLDGSCSVDTCPGICCSKQITTTEPELETPIAPHEDPTKPVSVDPTTTKSPQMKTGGVESDNQLLIAGIIAVLAALLLLYVLYQNHIKKKNNTQNSNEITDESINLKQTP